MLNIGNLVVSGRKLTLPRIQLEVNVNPPMRSGSVLSTETWGNEDQLVQTASDTPCGLAAEIWSREVTRVIHIADCIEAGNVSVNNYLNAATRLPVGGSTQSSLAVKTGGINALLHAVKVS